MMPAAADAAPRAESRDADMAFLDYLGPFESEGAGAVDPLVIATLAQEKPKEGEREEGNAGEEEAPGSCG